MPRAFPPRPVYPIGIDDDSTLYLVYNTSESLITSDNQAWEEEIPIKPVAAGAREIWPTNGFVSLDGELIYYDQVEYDSNGKINLFKNCIRNLGGTVTKFNFSGTSIRGFVVAEHHNQLADAIIAIEDFVGIDFDTRVETLDYRIRNLRETPVIFDDFTCPDVTLNFEIIQNDPVTGILAQFVVEIAGTYNSYRLDFGDGSFTTSIFQGTHQYASNANIDPVVTVGNSNCQIVQTPIERTSSAEPQPATSNPPLTITVPQLTEPPTFTYTPITLPPPEIQYPPIVFPCLDISSGLFPGISIGDINIQIPSVISFTPVNIPSQITISPVDIPSFIDITPVDIPSEIVFTNIPSFPPIGFGPVPTFAPIDISMTVVIDSNLPSCIHLCPSAMIGVDWGNAPTINFSLTKPQKTKTPEQLALMKELGDDYYDFYPEENDVDSGFGIPSEIAIIPPSIPPIQVKHDIPSTIEIFSHMPSSITIEHSIPDRIIVEPISPFPEKITIEGFQEEIRVVGIPDTIELVGPSEIKLTIDEDLKVPLVWEGPPIEAVVKLEIPKEWKTEEEGNGPCVMLVPCGPR